MKIIIPFCIVFFTAIVSMANGQGGNTGQAPSRPNCECQCNDYVWQDDNGKVHGNCRSSDHIGRWCYTDSFSCSDIRYSDKHTDEYGNPRKWSYQACATPPPWSEECRIRKGN